MSERLPKDSLVKLTLSGLAWQYTSVFTHVLLQLFVLAILARLVSPEDFGLIGIAMIFVGFATLFSQLGISPAIVQRGKLTTGHIRVGFTLSVLLGVAMVLILWALAPFIAAFFRNDVVKSVLYAVGLNFFFTSFGVVAEALLQRNMQFKKLMWIDLGAYSFGYALIGVTLAVFRYGVWALVGATLSQSLVKTVLLIVFQRHAIKPSLARRELRELLYFGGGFTLARIFNYGALQGDYFVIGRVLGAEALGLYTRSYQLMKLPARYFGQVVDKVLFPAMSKIQDEPQRLTRTYLTGVAVVSLVSAPISAFMVTTAPEIVKVLLGPQWSGSIRPFRILAIGLLFRTSYIISAVLIRALGAVYGRSVREFLYAAAVILGTWLGLRWGLPGAAAGVLLAITLNYILEAQLGLRLINRSWLEFVKCQIPGLLLAIIVAGVAAPIRLLLHVNGMPSFPILVITTLVSITSLVGLCFLRPEILGPYGISALSMVFRSMPAHFVSGTVLRWLEVKSRRYIA